MNPILEKIETADKKLVQFKKLAKQVFDEANADGLIDADEKKEIALVAGQIKAVQDVIQRLKDEFARNMAVWNGHSNDHAALQDQITKLREWGHPDVEPIEAAAGEINDAVLEQYWKEATAQLLGCMDEIKPIFDDYLLEYAARTKFLPLWEGFGPHYNRATETPFQTPTLNPAITELAMYAGNAERAAEALKYIAALEELANAQKALDIVEDEIKKLTEQKAEVDSLYATLKPRIFATQVSNFEAIADKSAEIGKAVESIDSAIDSCDFETALEELTSLVMSITSYETELAKIASAKEIYQSRLAAMQADLADATTCEFDELLALQDTIGKIRDRMEGLAANEDFENALIEMDLLAIELEDFKQQLIDMRIKVQFDELLAELEPRIFATAVSIYTPVDVISQEIDKDYQKAKSAALALEFTKGINLLEGLRPKLDAYEALLAEIEAAKTQYEAGVGEVIQRFDALAACEYPSMADTQQRAIDVRGEMERAAEKGDYPAALESLNILRSLMEDLEGELRARDDQRAEYDGRVAAVLARVEQQNVEDFTELVQPRAEMVKKRVAMEKSASENDFGMALDYMAQVEFALDTIEKRLLELNNIKAEFEAALQGIEAGLELVEGCTHVELAVKKAEILKARDAMQTAVNETKYDTALEKLKVLVPLLEAFEKLEEQLEEYTRRHDKAKPRVEAIKAIAYKSFKDQKEEVADLYSKMVGQANKAELTDALDNMDELEELLQEVEEALTVMQTDEIRYNDRLSVMQPEIDAIEENETDSAGKAKKAVLKAYEEMTDEADDDEFTKALKLAENVATLIKAFNAVLDALQDEVEKYNALKVALFKRLDKAEENAKNIERLSDDFDDLKALKKAAEDSADEDDYPAALESLAELDSGLTDFEAKWLALHDAQNKYTAESAAPIKKYEALTDEEKEKAETEYNTATGHYDKMISAASDEEFDDALEYLFELKMALDDIDDALLSESEVKQKCIGMYDVLARSISKAYASPYAGELGPALSAIDAAAKIGTDYKDRENYQGAIDEAPNIVKALDAFNLAEDALEQKAASQKVQYEERKSGFEKRYYQAKTPDNAPEDPDLATRVAALPAQWKTMIDGEGKNPVDYVILLELAADLRDEVDSILAALEAEEDAAKAGGGGEKEEDDDDGKWEWLENTGKKIVKDLSDKLIEEAFDQVGGRIDAIWDAGNHLNDAYNSYQDEDYWGVLSDTAKALKDAAKAHPMLNNPATKKIVQAVEWADDALGVYEKGAAIYDWITD